MRQLTIILTILSFLTSCDSKTAQDYFNEAEKLSDKGKYKEAIELLNKSIEKDNKFLSSYINRGADKSALGDYKGAIEDYKIVIQIDSNNTLALFNIGNNFKRLKDYKSAIEYYNKAFGTKGTELLYLDLTPNGIVENNQFDVSGCDIHYERGIAYYYIDSMQKAVNDFSASINKNYMTAECHCWLGYIYLATGQKEVACKNFRKSMELGDKDAEIELKKHCKE